MAVRILWLDDLHEQLDGISEALQGHDCLVDGVATPDEAVELVETNKYDLAMVDLRLQGVRDGFWFLKHMEDLPKEARPDRTAVLSSFLYLPHVREELRTVKLAAALIDKLTDDGLDDGDQVERLVQRVLALLDEGEPDSLSTQIDRAQLLEDDPLTMSYREFLALPIYEQTELQDLADDQLLDSVNARIQNGAIWVFYCGGPEPVHEAFDEDEVWDDAEVERYAAKHDRIPFVHESAGYPHIEDMPGQSGEVEGSPCDGVLYDYPSVQLDLEPNDDNASLGVFHFDTGLDVSMFSLEELVTRGALLGNPSGLPKRKTYPQQGRPIRYYSLEFTDVVVHCGPGAKQKIIVPRLVVRAVVKWDSCWLARKCSQHGCTFRGRASGVCVFRDGLVGRSLLTDNNLDLRISD